MKRALLFSLCLGLVICASAGESPIDQAIWMRRAELFENMGLLPLAREQYLFIAKKHPSDARVKKILSELTLRESDQLRGKIIELRAAGLTETALQNAERLCQLNPSDKRATVMLNELKNELALKQSVDARVAKDYAQGRDHFEKGRWDKALESFVRVLNMDPEHRGVLSYVDKIGQKMNLSDTPSAGAVR